MAKLIKSELLQLADSNTRSNTLEFVKNAKTIARTMANNYNQKKKAYEASKTSFHKTGSLDISRIHSYKTSDDLFKKNITMKEGASHGLVCNLDFSGSMSTIIENVAMQFLILALYCKYIKIDFQFFIWTSKFRTNHENPKYVKNYNAFKQSDGEAARFVDIGNSSMSVEDLIEMFYHLLAHNNASRRYAKYSKEYLEFLNGYIGRMSSTPLLAAVYQSYLLAKSMQDRGVQNVNILTINDGDNNCYFVNDDNNTNLNVIEDPYSGRIYTSPGSKDSLICPINKMIRDNRIKSYNMFLGRRLTHNGLRNVLRSYQDTHGLSGQSGESFLNDEEVRVLEKNLKNNNMAAVDNLCFYNRVMFVSTDMYPSIGKTLTTNNVSIDDNAVKYLANKKKSIKMLSSLGIIISNLMVEDFKIEKLNG